MVQQPLQFPSAFVRYGIYSISRISGAFLVERGSERRARVDDVGFIIG